MGSLGLLCAAALGLHLFSSPENFSLHLTGLPVGVLEPRPEPSGTRAAALQELPDGMESVSPALAGLCRHIDFLRVVLRNLGHLVALSGPVFHQ